MKTIQRVVAWVGLTLSVVGASAHVARASECGMGDVDWYAGERAKVSRATNLLDAGQARDAAWIVQTTWPRMREARPVDGSLVHIADAVRVMALACVRTDGNVREGLGWRSKSAEERAANVRWGIARLEMLASLRLPSALAKSDLGEALARSPETQPRAIGILDAAFADQSFATPEALSALARLRLAQGDREGAAAALGACMSQMPASDRCTSSSPSAEHAVTASR